MVRREAERVNRGGTKSWAASVFSWPKVNMRSQGCRIAGQSEARVKIVLV
jgi:hypothetical protein